MQAANDKGPRTKKKKSKTFKWVHISDLHFYSEEGAMVNTLKEKLPRTLAQIPDVDALFVTGDFRYAKLGAKETVEPVEYVNKLLSALGLDDSSLYCVPGNHDLTRTLARKYLVQGLAGIKGKDGEYRPEKGMFDSGVLQLLRTDFDYYTLLEQAVTGAEPEATDASLHKVIQHDKCNLLLLNTAITSCDDELDKGGLLLGVNYLKRALDQLDKSKPTIMLGHHGHSFLEREEGKEIQKYLSDSKIHIYLCGHEHDLIHESVWDNVQQFSAGCIWLDNTTIISKAGFYVGELDEAYNATVISFEWNKGNNEWVRVHESDPYKIFSPEANGEMEGATIDTTPNTEIDEAIAQIVAEYEPIQLQFDLNGYTLLGPRGKEGIKYYWLKNGDRVESLTFNKRQNDPHPDPVARAMNERVSAYTASMSFGCVLAASNSQCRFCETGARDFRGMLSAEEIALQNIFMAGYDANCPSYPWVRNHEREFAFMGQGEPGFSYPQIKRSILLTDRAMDAIKQKIYRYLISSCGISDFVYQLTNDVKSGIFPNRVSLHFSLHAVGNDRTHLMPIEVDYPYRSFIELCKNYYHTAHDCYGDYEKIGIGILAFKKFTPIKRAGESPLPEWTLDKAKLKSILSELDREIFRIDLSDFNPAPTVTEKHSAMSEEEIQILLDFVKKEGFEVKTFSSFGSGYDAGCGMLKSTYLNVQECGMTTMQKYDEALRILNYAIQKLRSEGI